MTGDSMSMDPSIALACRLLAAPAAWMIVGLEWAATVSLASGVRLGMGAALSIVLL